MAMKLLSPQEVKDTKAQEQTRDVIRTQEVKDALNSINKQFAKAQLDFNNMLLRNRTAWEAEEADHDARKRERVAEIEQLEAKRLKALEPVYAVFEEANQKLKKGLEMIVANETWRNTLSDTAELLEEKLSDVGEREIDVSKREDQVLMREQANEVETTIIKNGMVALTESQGAWEEQKREDELVINRRKEQLRLKEINFIAREQKIQRDVAAIERANVQIEDARGVILREYKRLNIPV